MKSFPSILSFICILFATNCFAQLSDLTLKVMDELNINEEDCEGLFAEKILPYAKDLSVIVIPKIGEQDEDVYSLDSYVVVVNNKTSIIKYHYFESYKTSGWDSDAIFLTEISIDTAVYAVKENTRAFGIVLHSRSMSRPNPYSSKYISLFYPKRDTLKLLLKNYQIYESVGENDMNCISQESIEKKVLIMSENKTNGFFDINVNIVNSEISTKEDGEDCVDTETSTNLKSVLTYVDGTYKEIKK